MSTENTVNQLPAPGIYPDVPAATYHGWDLPSASRLNRLNRSPAHLRWELDNPCDDSDALRIGEAVHLAVLQPEIAQAKIAVAPECDRRTKEGKAVYTQFCTDAVGKLIVSAREWEMIDGVCKSVAASRSAKQLLNRPGKIELSGVFDAMDALDTPIRTKFRADKLTNAGIVVDLKTTTDASREGFERSIFNFGYHRQAALYLYGLSSLGVDVDSFVFIAVEKTPPYAVSFHRLDDDSVAMGRREVIELLSRYFECSNLGIWPGYPDEIQDISLPAWVRRKNETFEGV